MSEPVKKPGQQPESYDPRTPEIVSMMEGAQDSHAFECFENIQYRYDYLELSDSLKFAGLPVGENQKKKGYTIEAFHQKYQHLIQHISEPYSEIHLWNNMTRKKGEWVYGCLVNSLDDLPKGIVGADTGWTRFVAMTIRCETLAELLDQAVTWGHYNTGTHMPEEYKDQVRSPAPGEWRGYSTIGVPAGCTSNVEIYPTSLHSGRPEMYFYIPLKEKNEE